MADTPANPSSSENGNEPRDYEFPPARPDSYWAENPLPPISMAEYATPSGNGASTVPPFRDPDVAPASDASTPEAPNNGARRFTVTPPPKDPIKAEINQPVKPPAEGPSTNGSRLRSSTPVDSAGQPAPLTGGQRNATGARSPMVGQPQPSGSGTSRARPRRSDLPPRRTSGETREQRRRRAHRVRLEALMDPDNFDANPKRRRTRSFLRGINRERRAIAREIRQMGRGLRRGAPVFARRALIVVFCIIPVIPFVKGLELADRGLERYLKRRQQKRVAGTEARNLVNLEVLAADRDVADDFNQAREGFYKRLGMNPLVDSTPELDALFFKKLDASMDAARLLIDDEIEDLNLKDPDEPGISVETREDRLRRVRDKEWLIDRAERLEGLKTYATQARDVYLRGRRPAQQNHGVNVQVFPNTDGTQISPPLLRGEYPERYLSVTLQDANLSGAAACEAWKYQDLLDLHALEMRKPVHERTDLLTPEELAEFRLRADMFSELANKMATPVQLASRQGPEAMEAMRLINNPTRKPYTDPEFEGARKLARENSGDLLIVNVGDLGRSFGDGVRVGVNNDNARTVAQQLFNLDREQVNLLDPKVRERLRRVERGFVDGLDNGESKAIIGATGVNNATPVVFGGRIVISDDVVREAIELQEVLTGQRDIEGKPTRHRDVAARRGLHSSLADIAQIKDPNLRRQVDSWARGAEFGASRVAEPASASR